MPDPGPERHLVDDQGGHAVARRQVFDVASGDGQAAVLRNGGARRDEPEQRYTLERFAPFFNLGL